MDECRRQTPIAGNATGNASGEQHDERSAARQAYQIRIRGHLDSRWSRWFGDLSMTHESDGTTVLTGPVADQPALHGLLIKIRDLGLPLLSVNALGPDTGGSSEPQQWSGSEPASGREDSP